MRLLEAESPLRGQVRIPGNLRILPEESSRRRLNTQVDVLPPSDIAGLEDARTAGEIELSTGLVEVEPPAFSHQPRDRIAGAKDAKVIACAVTHRILHATSVHRVYAGAHAIDRGIVVAKTNLVQVRTKVQLLNDTVLRMGDRDAQGLRRDAQRVLAPGNLLRRSVGADFQNWLRRAALYDAAVVVIIIERFPDCCNGDSDGRSSDRSDGDVHPDRITGDRSISVMFC